MIANGANYSAFFLIVATQVCALTAVAADEPNLLMRIDEYNSCRYTKR
jgi:hypothetical protein